MSAKPEPQPQPASQDLVVKRLECYTLRLKALSMHTQIQGLNEALKRASIELNTIPSRVKEIQKNLQTLEQELNGKYTELKAELKCPDELEINLETGEFVNPNRPQEGN